MSSSLSPTAVLYWRHYLLLPIGLSAPAKALLRDDLSSMAVKSGFPRFHVEAANVKSADGATTGTNTAGENETIGVL
jgi:hypothetical protein